MPEGLFVCICAGTANNAGAILVLGRDLVVVPKLIHPLPPAISSPETSPERHIDDTWMQVLHLYPWIFNVPIILVKSNTCVHQFHLAVSAYLMLFSETTNIDQLIPFSRTTNIIIK